jgi:hypothetical protein
VGKDQGAKGGGGCQDKGRSDPPTRQGVGGVKRLAVFLLFCDLLCFARPKYDHTAKVTYRAEQKHLKYLLEGRDDLYYDDSYYGDNWICTPGDEHHAPDCRKSQDWYVYEVDRRASFE